MTPIAPSTLDSAAHAVGEQLAAAFGLARHRPTPCPGTTPIGLEIEVPWSSYFPELWERFDLAHRKVRDLSVAETNALSAACADLEKDLLPRLHRTVACGVPRGNDRYWEFALDPVHDVTLLTHQVALLGDAGLLPRNRRHSLQITLGNLRATADVYHLAMLLELHTVDAHRVTFGLDQARAIVHTGWARKGQAGVLQKGASDLKHGSTVACELRLLSLPTEDGAFDHVMRLASFGANAIAQVQAGQTSELTERWRAQVAWQGRVLREHGLPNRRWKDRSQDASVWAGFAGHLDGLREQILAGCELLDLKAMMGVGTTPPRLTGQPG